jgi:hypothetical protein
MFLVEFKSNAIPGTAIYSPMFLQICLQNVILQFAALPCTREEKNKLVPGLS